MVEWDEILFYLASFILCPRAFQFLKDIVAGVCLSIDF